MNQAKATNRHCEIRTRYTRVTRVGGEPDEETEFTVWLVAGPQSFCVTPTPCSTLQEAEWFRTMLARAIAEIILQMNTTKPNQANDNRPE